MGEPPDDFGPRPTAPDEVDAEIAFHIEMREAQNRARGMDGDSARDEALRRFGNVSRVREACLDEAGKGERMSRVRRIFAGLGTDVRQAVRHLRQSPAYAVVAVLTLALGIGANALIYGFTAPYFLRPLPFDDADRLVHLYQVDPRSGYPRERFSMPQYRDLLERSRGFDDIAAYDYRSVNVTGAEGPERLTVGRLTANAFDVLGVRPLLGRTFAAGEDAVEGGADVVVLGWGVWQRRWAGDPAILGRTIMLDGQPRTVVGIMPREFNFPFGGVKLWIPLANTVDGVARDVRPQLLFGRLAEGWTAERAHAELAAIHATLARAYPEAEGQSDGIVLVGMREALNFGYDILRMASAASAAAVALLLLIACANIAGLGLARAEARRRELAVRNALGATSFRLVRQLLVETLVVAALGGLLGVVMARVGLNTLGSVIPEDLFRVGDFTIDAGALAFIAGVVVLAALAAGIGPALLASRSGTAAVLREDGRAAGSLRAGRLRRLLVTGEVAVGLVLIVGAGLTARSLGSARTLPLGFTPGPVLTVEVTLPEAAYPDGDAIRAFYDRYTTALAALPSVAAVGTQTALPLNHETPSGEISIEGVPIPDDERPRAHYFRVSPGYVDAMDIALLEGRDFSAQDGPGGERVALVNRTFATRLLEGDAVGRRIRVGEGEPRRIVGVVGDVRHEDIAAAVAPQLYVPAAQGAVRRQFVVLRTAGDPAAAIPDARATLASLDADLPAVFTPMRDVVGIALLQWSVLAAFLALFGGFALLLGAIGLYGVIAYSVERRRKEIGVRLALGAHRRDVTRMIVWEGVRLAGLGVVIGLAGALVAGRLIAALLFGVRPGDPVTLSGAALLFLVVALLASVIPARRAMRAGPLEALRGD